MRALGERTIICDCDVLQADGGHAHRRHHRRLRRPRHRARQARLAAGTLKDPIPLKQMIAATSVGIVDGNTLLDLCYEEDSRATVDMNVVMLADPAAWLKPRRRRRKDSYSPRSAHHPARPSLKAASASLFLEIQQQAPSPPAS